MRSVVRASRYSLHNMFFHLRALKLRRQKLQDVPTTSPKKSVDKNLISILVRSPVPVPFPTTSDLLSISYEGCVEFLSWNEMGHGTLILGFAKMFCRVRPGNVPNFKTHVHSFLNSVFSYSRGQFNYLKTFIKKTIAGLKRRWLSVWCSNFSALVMNVHGTFPKNTYFILCKQSASQSVLKEWGTSQRFLHYTGLKHQDQSKEQTFSRWKKLIA